MELLIREFWSKLEGILRLLAFQLLAEHADLKIQIGNTSNDVFPLRAYLTILKSNEGDELSITVDIISREYGVLIESDVVGEEGVIIADGPLLELHGDLSDPVIQDKLNEWFKSFERLFIEKHTYIEAAIKKLE